MQLSMLGTTYHIRKLLMMNFRNAWGKRSWTLPQNMRMINLNIVDKDHKLQGTVLEAYTFDEL